MKTKNNRIIEVKELPVVKQDLIDVFAPKEGGINFYYGRIGNGKTYNATADVIELLKMGHVVYVNWIINWNGFDERDSFIHLFFKTLFFRKYFYSFPKENLRYFNPDDVTVEFLSGLNDCHIFIDEGQWIFDSYEGTKFSKEKRRLILHTRHLNRSLNIISQRTQAVQVSARGQVNRFYKCEKVMGWPFLVFMRSEYQDMKDNDVDESDESRVSRKVYIARKEVLNAYDTKYLRAGVPTSQEIYFKAYRYRFVDKLKLFIGGHRPRTLESPRSGSPKVT